MVDKYISEIKIESKKLSRRIKPIFEKFVDGKVSLKTKIKTEFVEDSDEIFGTKIIEELSLAEADNGLVGLSVRREYFIDYKTNERSGADESYSINLYWWDFDEHLKYETSYYPEMDNDIIYNKTKILLNSALSFIEYDIKRRKIKHE